MISRYASLRQGLVGAWCPSVQRCGSGFTLPDLSGYGNHGTLTNMDPGTDWVASGSGLALDFDGSNDYINISINLSGVITSKQYTVCCWINTSSTNSNTYPFSLGSTASDTPIVGFRIDPGGNGRIIALLRDDAFNSQLPGNDPILVNNAIWNNIVVVASGSNAQLYTNAKTNGSSVSISSLGATTINRATIGALGRTSIAAYYSGLCDDARIYNRALTPSEIQLLYTGGRGVGLAQERIKHRRKTTAAAFNRRRRLICGANC
jgi:hypothetical protein